MCWVEAADHVWLPPEIVRDDAHDTRRRSDLEDWSLTRAVWIAIGERRHGERVPRNPGEQRFYYGCITALDISES